MRKSVEEAHKFHEVEVKKPPFSALKISAALVILVLTVVASYTSWNYADTLLHPPKAQAAHLPQQTYITIGTNKIAAIWQDYTSDDSLWRLVNKQHPLQTNYAPKNLVTPKLPARSDLDEQDRKVRAELITPLADMFNDAKKSGHDLMLASTYRSADTQQTIYSQVVAANGQETADKYTAHAGQSEHQTGLAVDINSFSPDCTVVTCTLTPEAAAWIGQHAANYGFILRYPEAKEAITGYSNEPWHFRYVGKNLAQALYKNNLTLDEIEPQLTEASTALKHEKAI